MDDVATDELACRSGPPAARGRPCAAARPPRRESGRRCRSGGGRRRGGRGTPRPPPVPRTDLPSASTVASVTPVGADVLGQGAVGHGGQVPVGTVETMRLGVHYANFTHPDWEHRLADAAHRDRAGRGPGRRRPVHGDGPLVPDGDPRRPAGADARGLHDARLPGRGHRAAAAEPAGHRRDLPAPRRCWPRPSPPSTCSRAAGRCSGSAPRGTSREHAGLGVPFPSMSERFERLEETLQVVRQMWAGDAAPYAGKHYQLAEPVNVPPPVQQPAADHDRRQRGAEDAAAGRRVRRRLQHLRRSARRDPPQAGRATRPLRRRRAATTTRSRRR